MVRVVWGSWARREDLLDEQEFRLARILDEDALDRGFGGNREFEAQRAFAACRLRTEPGLDIVAVQRDAVFRAVAMARLPHLTWLERVNGR